MDKFGIFTKKESTRLIVSEEVKINSSKLCEGILLANKVKLVGTNENILTKLANKRTSRMEEVIFNP